MSFEPSEKEFLTMKHTGLYPTISPLFVSLFIATVAFAQTAPTILEHPQSFIASYGGTASFSVTAEGTDPLNYRWRSNRFTVAITTTNRFWLTNASEVALYDVVVSNPHGQKLSRPAVLSLFAYERTQNNLDLKLAGLSAATSGSNYVYEIQYKPDLAITEWAVFTNLVLPESTVTFQTWTVTNGPQGFFRAVLREQ
jgi:hypothetical protein